MEQALALPCRTLKELISVILFLIRANNLGGNGPYWGERGCFSPGICWNGPRTGCGWEPPHHLKANDLYWPTLRLVDRGASAESAHYCS